eukprot:6034959-Pyramimonas_sp.AAC.1
MAPMPAPPFTSGRWRMTSAWRSLEPASNDLTSQGACRELRANRGYEGVCATAAPMGIVLLRLGGVGSPVDLDQLLRDGRSELY